MDDDVARRLGAVAPDDAIDLHRQIPTGIKRCAADDTLAEFNIGTAQLVDERVYKRPASRDAVRGASGGGFRHGRTIRERADPLGATAAAADRSSRPARTGRYVQQRPGRSRGVA